MAPAANNDRGEMIFFKHTKIFEFVHIEQSMIQYLTVLTFRFYNLKILKHELIDVYLDDFVVPLTNSQTLFDLGK